MDSFAPPAWPPYIHFRDWPVPPPPLAYIREDDYLAVTVLTSSTTTGLALRYRILQAGGGVIDGAETLDGAETNTIRTTIYPLTEGFLLSATVSNIGSGFADSVCGVILALQKGGQASSPPHTILAQGFVSNIVGVTWPVGLPRGPATSTSFADWPGLLNSPDRPPSTTNAMNDEFDGASLSLTKWTWVNQGTSSAALANSFLQLTGQRAVTQTMRMIVQTLPTPPWGFAVKLFAPPLLGGTITSVSLVLRESATSKLMVFNFDMITNRAFPQLEYWADENHTGAAIVVADASSWGDYIYLRCSRAGSNLSWDASPDGATWAPWLTEALTTHFTTAPNQVGIGAVVNHATLDLTVSADWFRRVI